MLPRKYRKQAKLDNKAIAQAMIASAGIAAQGHRRMARLKWEGERSPSSLGRAAERAQQWSAIVGPSAATAVTVFNAIRAGLELYDAIQARRNKQAVDNGAE